jgi:hypothetical protein
MQQTVANKPGSIHIYHSFCVLQTDEHKETVSILSQKPCNNKKEPFWTQLHGPSLPNQTVLEYKIKTTNRKQEKNWHNIDDSQIFPQTLLHILVETENLIKATTPPKAKNLLPLQPWLALALILQIIKMHILEIFPFYYSQTCTTSLLYTGKT